ncbi:MAG: hypothetical protein ACT452_08075 [Microthrixaceae bacterium]
MRWRIYVAWGCVGIALAGAGCASNEVSAEAEVCNAFASLAAAIEQHGSVAAIPDSAAVAAWKRISGAGEPDDHRFAEFISDVDYQGGNQLLLAVSDADMDYAEQTCQALGYDIVPPVAHIP